MIERGNIYELTADDMRPKQYVMVIRPESRPGLTMTAMSNRLDFSEINCKTDVITEHLFDATFVTKVNKEKVDEVSHTAVRVRRK